MTAQVHINPWRDEKKVEQLRALFNQGKTFSEIGEALGVTRCSAIGKCNRLGLIRYIPGGNKDKSKPKTRPNNGVSAASRAQRIKLGPKLCPEPPPPERIEDQKIPKKQRKTLLSLGDDDCRWPVGTPGTPDFFFCGGPAMSDQPYCAYHSVVAYGAPQPRRAGGFSFFKTRAA